MKKTEFTSGDYTYILREDGTAEITDYDGQADVLEIPAQLDGYTVTSISEEMCYDRSGVCSVTIPDSVVSLGANPFELSALTSIQVFPDHPVFETINGVLFDKTEKKLICYPCSFPAESYVIPQGIRVIGAEAFYGCSALRSVTIPDSVISIGDYAFSFCNSLWTVPIPTSVSSIGERAFSGCSDNLNFTAGCGSYAAEYAKDHGIACQYSLQEHKSSPLSALVSAPLTCHANCLPAPNRRGEAAFFVNQTQAARPG